MTEQTTPMMLEIADLEVRYGGIRALHHLSLKVPQGSIVTLIGANGAGKSTLVAALAGELFGIGRSFGGFDPI